MLRVSIGKDEGKMKKRLNKLTLIELLVLIICYGDLVYTYLRLLIGIITGESISLTMTGIIISLIELIISEVCYDELEKRVSRVSL